MYKRLFLTVFIVFTITIAGFSQGKVGSPYTRYSIGDINNNPLARNNGLGGVSYTLPYRNNVNYINPAGVANIDTMTFIFDFGLQGGGRSYEIKDPKLKETKYDYQISYINFGFSINRWWKMALGITPYSNVGYNIMSSDSLLNVHKNYRFEGNGGITKIFWNNSVSPLKNLRLGVNAVFLFGEIYHYNAITFDEDVEEGFMNIIEQNKSRISDFSFDAGIQYDININSKNKITIGAVYGHNKDLKAYQSSFVYNRSKSGTIVDTLYISDENKGIVSLPMSLGFGIGYCYDDKLFVGIDYTLQNWKNAQFFNSVDSLGNGNYFSMGIEYIPGGYKGLSYKYKDAISYRLGGYYNETYFKLSTGQVPIKDFGISFGVGLPVKRSKTSFDISVKLGQRGSIDDSLIRERYFIVGVGFNLADVWFIKSKFD
ncbi:MAG: hypothetical protein LBQ22_08175 [Bacteroidales bacterium]|jgi:hypothetical protein|nr:hypothetical protein [Bacteroidales bacterium]